jgi:hypothetical protein
MKKHPDTGITGSIISHRARNSHSRRGGGASHLLWQTANLRCSLQMIGVALARAGSA